MKRTLKQVKSSVFAITVFTVLALAAVSCNDSAEDNMEEAGQNIEEAADTLEEKTDQ